MILTLAIDPGLIKNNDRYTIAHGRLILSGAYRSGCEHCALMVRQACIVQQWRTTERPVRVVMTTWWPTRRGDVDATSKAVLDSLQNGGAIANDAQVVELVARKGVDKDRPRIEVEIFELED